jgi:acetolactate synthase-1/2/3 large subunit
VAEVVREAFYIARSGRPGPVLIDFCKNAQIEQTEFVYPEQPSMLGYKPPLHAPAEDLKEAAKLIAEAERPVILAGHGVLKSGAMQQLRDFAVKTQTPVAMTLLGLGGLPASHPLSLGMMGMHGEAFCNNAIQGADLLLAFGMRFDDRVTGNLRTYAPRARKIHVEIDPSEIHKNVRVDVPLVGDLRVVLDDLLPLVEPGDHEEWLEQIAEWKEETVERDIMAWPEDGLLYSSHVIRDIWRGTKGASIVTTDVGQHQMWAAQYYHFEQPYHLITSGGAGTMGFGMPSAIGAWFGNKDREIWAIVGDGGFQMTQAELATAAQEQANVKIAILNNSYLGMVRQWQELFFENHLKEVPIPGPDYVKLAHAYGIPAKKVSHQEDVMPALREAQHHQGPYLIEFVVNPSGNVYPMIPPGGGLADTIEDPLTSSQS